MRRHRLPILFLALTSYLSGCTPERDPANTIIHGVNFVGMVVSDLEASAPLYETAANLQPVADTSGENATLLLKLAGEDAVGVDTRMMVSVNAQLRLMEFEYAEGVTVGQPVPVNGPGIAHVCYQVAKDTQSYQQFLAGGATTIGAEEMIALNPRNPVAYAYAHDPDGIMFEVEHVDIAALETDTPPKNRYRIRHVSLATTDMDRAVDFYSQLLNEPEPRRVGKLRALQGESFDKVSGMAGSKLEMAWFQVRNLELEIVEYKNPRPVALIAPRSIGDLGYNMIVFDVADLDAVRERVLAAGGTIEVETAAMDGGEIFFGRDPDGNLLGFQRVPDTALASSKNFTGNGT